MVFDIGLVKALIAVGRPLSVPGALSRVLEVDHNGRAIVIKYGAHVWQTEALAMKLVRENTNVPVPRLYNYFSEEIEGISRSRCGYIVMEKMDGVTLQSIIDSLDTQSVEAAAADLAAYIRELHKLDREGWGMTGKNGFFHRGRFSYDVGPCRISSTKEFVGYFARAAKILQQGDEGLSDSDISGIELSRPPVFSHGDLVPENIMCDPASHRIIGIIDWEHAGCYPYFWNTLVAKRRVAPYSANWERIYSMSMEDCNRAAAKFGWYYTMADIYGTSELSETLQVWLVVVFI